MPEYQEYQKLKVMVMSAGFDKKLHAVEYKAYQEIIRQPKIAALIKLEKLRRFKEYREVKDTICHKSLRIWKLISVRKNSSETELIS